MLWALFHVMSKFNMRFYQIAITGHDSPCLVLGAWHAWLAQTTCESSNCHTRGVYGLQAVVRY